MSEKRINKIVEILKSLDQALTTKSNQNILNQINKNLTNSFEQMCYYQSYQDKKDNLNFMKKEYEKFKGIYLCYKNPKTALLALKKGLISPQAEKGILTHFLFSENTSLFRKENLYPTQQIFLKKQKETNGHYFF